MPVYRNNVNAFPHSTFNWVGIDGTQVLCHMTPVGTTCFAQFGLQTDRWWILSTETYNAQVTAGEIVKALTNHKVLILYLLTSLPLTTVGIESRIKLDVAPRFRKWRWRRWPTREDA